MTRPILLVFLKDPQPGRAKTRLAGEMGPEAAAGLYRQWIGLVLRSVQPVRDRVRLIGYFDGSSADRFAEWSALADEWLPQPAGDLGQRLATGFARGHSLGRPVIAIGTDCLDITATHITDALDVLVSADAVFGPATDGGYYLVGTNRHVDGLFDRVRWSSPHTLADQSDRARQLGLRVSLLAELADIDTLADWHAYLLRQGERP